MIFSVLTFLLLALWISAFTSLLILESLQTSWATITDIIAVDIIWTFLTIRYVLSIEDEDEDFSRNDWILGVGILVLQLVVTWDYYLNEYEPHGTFRPDWTKYLG